MNVKMNELRRGECSNVNKIPKQLSRYRIKARVVFIKVSFIYQISLQIYKLWFSAILVIIIQKDKLNQ